MNPLVIGADIGGTHITAALVDLEKGSIVPDSLTRSIVDSHVSAAEIMEVWSRTIIKVGQEHLDNKVSLAIPGPFDYENGICLIKDQNKYENLYGLNVKQLLSEKLNIKSANITLINDAISFLQGEVFGGAAIGFKKVIGITLGTGLGTCVFEDNVYSNASLWDIPFKTGIAEDYLSARWLINRYFEITGKKVSGVRELSALAETDPAIKPIFSEFGNNLADFLSNFLSVIQPEVVILGGNITKGFDYFKEPLLHRLNTSFSGVEIKTALLGEEAALIGAASYWKDKNTSSQIR